MIASTCADACRELLRRDAPLPRHATSACGCPLPSCLTAFDIPTLSRTRERVPETASAGQAGGRGLVPAALFSNARLPAAAPIFIRCGGPQAHADSFENI